VDGWIDGWMDEWMDGWRQQFHPKNYYLSIKTRPTSERDI